MKTKLILTTLLLITFSCLTINAKSIYPTETKTINKEQISDFIASKITFTDELAKEINQGEVYVSISINERHVVINGINSSNQILENYIKKQLNQLDIPIEKLDNKEIVNLKFVFQKNQ